MITIAGTPPRDASAAAARKRGRPDAGHGSASSSLSSGAAASVPSSSLFQPRHPMMCSPSPHGHGQQGFMPLVSPPFMDRQVANSANNAAGRKFPPPVLRLEPVAEEAKQAPGCTVNFSQTSNSSSVTFAASHTSELTKNGASCGRDGALDHNEEIVGVMVGGAAESVVECSTRGGSPSSLSSGEYSNDNNGMVQVQTQTYQCQGQQYGLPPSKRARSDGYQFRAVTQSVDDDGASPMDMACDSPGKKYGACMNLRTNVDKPRGLCCHVCSTESDAGGNVVMEEGRHAPTAMAEAPGPRSHSLLSYFRPAAKKQAPFPASKASAASAHSPLPSNLAQCRYCDKLTCAPCSRPCEQCQHRFCTFCTKVNYASSVERILCFECDERLSAMGGGGGNGDGDCDMMDL